MHFSFKNIAPLCLKNLYTLPDLVTANYKSVDPSFRSEYQLILLNLLATNYLVKFHS